MDSHKKILSILYIVTGAIQMLALMIAQLFISTIIPFIAHELDQDEQWVLELVTTIVPVIMWGIILIVSLPSIIGGFALLKGSKWALTLLLVMGCLKLFSFPFGTALGVYTIWVYAEDNKQNQQAA